MRRIHIAIATQNLAETVEDYNTRFGFEPSVMIVGEYALWRNECVNFSVRQDPSRKPGELRHLGWEHPDAVEFTKSTDVNGIVWECFTEQQQVKEIELIWPRRGRPRQ